MQQLNSKFKKLFLLFSVTLSSVVHATDWLSYNITVNKHKLHYYQAGEGEALFLLTGYATTSNFWNKSFVNCLAKEHKVYLVDYWGINTGEGVTGNSSIEGMADDMYTLSKALKAEHPVFAGWSMGGAVAAQIGFDHYSDGVNKVVLIAPLTMNNQPPPLSDADADEIVEPLRTYNDVLNYVFDNNLYGYTRKQLNFYKYGLFDYKNKLFPDRKISASQNNAMNIWASDPNTKENAKYSNAKYLFLIPLQDKMLVTSKTLSDAKLFPNKVIVNFDGSGHNISMQAPEQTCQQITRFID